jgi:dihydroxy-acid dehydratase
MDAKVFDKSKLPSRYVTTGPQRAPHRSYLYAMGLSQEQIGQPLVGVASCWNEAAPCNISLMRQAQAVKKGVATAKGTPREFCTITVTDGIAMGHQGMKASLAQPGPDCRFGGTDHARTLLRRDRRPRGLRQVPAGHDDVDGAPQCAVDLLYGGSILPGSFRGRQITIQDVFEAVGSIRSASMSDEDLLEIEQVACPSAGSCGAQFTANTMATVAEAIGLALPYSCGAPAPYEIRDRFCAMRRVKR